MSKEDAAKSLTETVEDVAGDVTKSYASLRENICSVPLIGQAFEYIEVPVFMSFAMWLMWTVVGAIGYTMPALSIVGLALGVNFLANLTAWTGLRTAKLVLDNRHLLSTSKSK